MRMKRVGRGGRSAGICMIGSGMLNRLRRPLLAGFALGLPALFVVFGMTALAESPSPATSLGATPGTQASPGGEALPGDPAKGQQLYQQSCTACHGPNLEGGVGARLNPILGGPKNLDPNYLITTITNGES